MPGKPEKERGGLQLIEGPITALKEKK